MRNAINKAYISMNDSEFVYFLMLMKSIGVSTIKHMPPAGSDVVVYGNRVRIRKRFITAHISLLLLAYYDNKNKRPRWMSKLRILLKDID